MKRIYMMIAFVSVFVAAGMQAQTKTVERPPVMYGNTRTVEFSKITLSDTATVLDVEATYRPGNWIRIASDTYLKAGDKKYMIRHGEGITLDSLFWMPQSGQASFKLVFEPIPLNTPMFDFMEGDCESCFKVYGVDLVNPRLQLPPVPEEFARKHQPEENFVPGFEEGEARISGRLLGYISGPDEIKLQYTDPLVGNYVELSIPIAPDGTFGTSFRLHSPVHVSLRSRFGLIPIKVAPGKESKVLVHLPELYRRGSRLFKDSESYGEPFYYAGYLAGLNTELNDGRISYAVREEQIDSILDLDIHAYKQYVMRKYEETVAHNAALDISPLAKNVLKAEAAFEVQNKLAYPDFVLREAYAKKHNLSRQEAAKQYTSAVKPEGYNDYLRLLPYDRSELLLVPYVSYGIQNLVYASPENVGLLDALRYLTAHEKVAAADRNVLNAYIEAQEKKEKFEDQQSLEAVYTKYKKLVDAYNKEHLGPRYLAKIWNTDKAFLLDLVCAQQISAGLKDFNPLTDEQKAELETLPPVIARIITDENTRLLARIEENKRKTGFTILDVPQSPDETLFVDMLKPFKGKVVLVDVWATWCGPCRIANKEMEPVKAQMADKDVVFLYLAGENSPENTWKNMIADLKGQHYRVNKAQWDYLSKSLNARGVPTYVIIDREGNHAYHTTGFPGAAVIKNELLKALEK